MLKVNRFLAIVALFFFVVSCGGGGGGGSSSGGGSGTGGSSDRGFFTNQGITDADGKVSFNIADKALSFKIIDSDAGIPLQGAFVYAVSDGDSVLVLDPLNGYLPTVAQIDNIQSLSGQNPVQLLSTATTSFIAQDYGVHSQVTVKQNLFVKMVEKLSDVTGGYLELLDTGLTREGVRKAIIEDSKKIGEDDIIKASVSFILATCVNPEATAGQVLLKLGTDTTEGKLLALDGLLAGLESADPHNLYTLYKIKGLLSVVPFNSYLVKKDATGINVLAGSGKINGVVTVDGVPAPNVTVEVFFEDSFAPEKKLQTDYQGSYTVDGLADGRWRVQFKYSSYAWSPQPDYVTIKDAATVTLNKNLVSINTPIGLKVFPKDISILSSASTYIDLKNYSIFTLSWQVNNIPPWLTVFPSDGQLNMFEHTQIKLSVIAAQSGDATIIFTSNLGDMVLVKVSAVSLTTWTDSILPSVPSGLSASAVSSTQINLLWNASTDNVGVSGYKIYRDGTYLKSVTTTATSDTGLSPNTQYCYKVSAYDAAGNESGQSTQACRMTTTTLCATAATGSATITSNSAILNGVVNPNGVTTEAFFQYGTSTAYGYTTSSQVVGSGTSNVNVMANLSSLSQNTTYYYRIVATTNSCGTIFGTNQTFTTPSVGCTLPSSFTLSANAYCKNQTAPAVLITGINSSGMSTFDLYRNGSLYSPSNTGTYFDNSANVVAGQTYTYYVVAKNSCGSTQSNNTTTITVPSNVCPTYKEVTVANTSGIGINLRNGAGIGYSVITGLPEGTRMSVIGGPVQADGYTWWNITGSSGTGWSAIGEWITPITPQLNTTATVTYTGGYGLRLRSCASLSCSVITTLPDGTQMTVFGGPMQADGYTWWALQGYAGGILRTGWSAVGNWLVPNPRY